MGASGPVSAAAAALAFCAFLLWLWVGFGFPMLILDLKILVEKVSIRLNKTTHGDQLILVDPVEDDEDDPGPRTRVGLQLTMRSK